MRFSLSTLLTRIVVLTAAMFSAPSFPSELVSAPATIEFNRDSTHYDFMMQMGIWIENLSLPAVVNECLLQSYSGTIRLFPNTQGLGAASFQDLRAVGAFLVSAAYDGKKVLRAEIHSEKGAECRLAQLWGASPVQITQLCSGQVMNSRREGEVVVFSTQPGQRYRVEAA